MEHMTVKQVAEYLDVDPSTIYRWVKNDTIPHSRHGHWVLKFDVDEIDAWQAGKLAKNRKGGAK